jgi:hypothetical protein
MEALAIIPVILYIIILIPSIGLLWALWNMADRASDYLKSKTPPEPPKTVVA